MDEGWRTRTAALVLFGPAVLWLCVAALGLGASVVDANAWGPAPQGRHIVQSQTCARCHERAYASWHRSYHRTMTQPAGPETVLAPFAGEHLDALGFRATMDRGASGQPRVRIAPEGGGAPILEAEVELTIGSHRYQQYVARIDRGGGPLERHRLPVAWHIDEARWIHLSSAFLLPEGVPGQPDAYLRQLSRWNDNCVLCHNTEPVPGLAEDGRFHTAVGEIGIACEACHGPASAHVARHASPFRRMAAAFPHAGDPSIVHPLRLAGSLGTDVCGRCHGNRIAHDLASVLAHGDGFVPGDPLADRSRPIYRDTRLAHDPPDAEPFAARFWPNGTPRLSAYEYQALVLSPCHDQGRGLQCSDCHSMHGPEPSMQLRSDVSVTATCDRCHGGLARDHGGHVDVPCTGCHMPRITYGLLEGMITHRIGSPAPAALVGRDDEPDACTQCHVDRSRAWAAGAMASLGFDARPVPVQEPAIERRASRVELDLHGGDPIQRALAAHALARPEAAAPPRDRMRALVDAFEDDYPAVRWFAWRGLRALARTLGDAEALARLEATAHDADAAERIAATSWLRARFGPSAVARVPALAEALEAARDDRAIEIGE